MDEEFLVVWDGFAGADGGHSPSPPWRSVTEPELRKFLLDRCQEGFCFPINPVWPVRDPGWFEVFRALQKNADGARNLRAWLPPDSGIVELIEQLHAAQPSGFRRLPMQETVAGSEARPGASSLVVGARKLKAATSLLAMFQDLDTTEMACFVESEVEREVNLRWKRIRNAFRVESMHRKLAMKAKARAEAEAIA